MKKQTKEGFTKFLYPYKTEDILNCLPENKPMLRDSGRWVIYDEDMKNVLADQNVGESFRDFLIRYLWGCTTETDYRYFLDELFWLMF